MQNPMPASPTINEASFAQFPMIRYATEIGWQVLSRDEALALRGGESGKFFRSVLEEKLRSFNPWLSKEAVGSLYEKLDSLPANIEGNREILLWLRGEKQLYDEKEKRSRPVTLIDFSTIEANTFHVTWEWTMHTTVRQKKNRADVIFIINGVPVAIVEHKNPKDSNAIERGMKQLRRYEQETPELLATPQLFNVTHNLDYWYGVTWNITRRDMARWKQAKDETYRFAVQSFFEPHEFLRTLQQWILFYVQDGEIRKSILRQHQRRAIEAIMQRCLDQQKTRGLVWHTQGSGKTFTLLTAARLILEDKKRFAHATVILVVDRSELEGQLKGWVDRLLGEMQGQDIAVKRAESKASLQNLLDSDFRGLIIAMIHKFSDLRKDSCLRDNVYIFIDEAHRSVAHDLGTCMMAALPNATMIGFTGTPVAHAKQGRGTFKIFGTQDEKGYLDKYSIAESIDDETTLPIKYCMAPSEMTIPTERLDEEFFALADSEDVTSVEELNRVLDRAVGIRTFLMAEDRVAKVAAFIAQHFKENVLPLGYKAFVVAVNREACAKYKEALDQHLPEEWSKAVYTENVNDRFERPLVAEKQLSKDEEEKTRSLFKKADQDPKILIVTDKLLTGYDAPPLYCLYLDKPMRDHVLLQTIARVNRPYIDANGVPKTIGLVIDFVGVLRELKKALNFDSSDMSGVVEDLEVLLQDFLKRIDEAKKHYLEEISSKNYDEQTYNEQIEKWLCGRFLDPEERKTFFEAYKTIENLWEILSPSPELRDYTDIYKQLSNLYCIIRNFYAEKTGFMSDLAHKTRRLIEKNAEQTGLGGFIKEVTFDVDTLNALCEAIKKEKGEEVTTIFNLVRGLHKEIDEHPENAPILQPIKERVERIVKDLENRKTTSDAVISELALIAGEKEKILKESRESGLSPGVFRAYLFLRDDANLKEAQSDPMVLAKEVEKYCREFPNARFSAEERRSLRSKLYKPFVAFGYHDEKEIGRVVNQVMEFLLAES